MVFTFPFLKDIENIFFFRNEPTSEKENFIGRYDVPFWTYCLYGYNLLYKVQVLPACNGAKNRYWLHFRADQLGLFVASKMSQQFCHQMRLNGGEMSRKIFWHKDSMAPGFLETLETGLHSKRDTV